MSAQVSGNTGGTDAISRLMGIPPKTIDALWKQVRENRNKLNACPRHRFPGGEVHLGAKPVCINCGGELGVAEIGAYIRGYEAKGGSADDIWPEYHKRK